MFRVPAAYQPLPSARTTTTGRLQRASTCREVLPSRRDRSPEMPCEPTTTAAASRSTARSTIASATWTSSGIAWGSASSPERIGEPGTVSGDDRGVMLPRLVNFGHELRIKRDLDGPGCVQTGVEHRHRGQSGLPHGDNQRDAAGEELGSTAHRGVGEIRAVVGNQHTRLRPRHAP